jgi:hypothetical protein
MAITLLELLISSMLPLVNITLTLLAITYGIDNRLVVNLGI